MIDFVLGMTRTHCMTTLPVEGRLAVRVPDASLLANQWTARYIYFAILYIIMSN